MNCGAGLSVNTTGMLVMIVSANSFYVLRSDRDAYQDQVDEGVEIR